MMAMMATVAPTATVSMATIMRLLNHDLARLVMAPHHQRQQGRDGKENAVHDAKRKRRLEHGARLVGLDAEAGARRTEVPDSDGPTGAVGRSAIGVGDETQRVHGADEGTHKEQVDQRDKECVRLGAVVGEECADGPGGAEHRDDEEHEDVIRG